MINSATVTPTEAKSLMRALWDLKYVPMLWGRPGVGKTQMVHQLGAEMGAEVWDLPLVSKLPSDLTGLPMLDRVAETTRYLRPEFLPHDNKPRILFLDELPAADEATRAACYGLILERRVGSYVLPDQCRVVAAGNRPEDGATSFDLGTAMYDRLVHVTVEPNSSDWLNWAMDNKVAREVMAYIKVHPQELTSDDKMIEQGHAIVPTPRSWERVSRLLGATKDRRVREIGIMGIVGDAVGSKFIIMAEELATMASVETILKTPKDRLHTVVPKTLNGLWALSYAMASVVSKETAGPILELTDALDSVDSTEHRKLPLADVQSLMSALTLERMFKMGIDCSKHPAFIRYDERRRAERSAADARSEGKSKKK